MVHSIAYMGLGCQIVEADSDRSGGRVQRMKATSKRITGMTEAIIEVLRTSPTPWLTAPAITKLVSERMGKNVPRTSISPKLSELKSKNRILRHDMFVALPERAAIEETRERSLLDEDVSSLLG